MKIVYFLIAILLGINNVFINFRIGPISIDRLLELALFFLLFKSFLKELNQNTFLKSFCSFIIILAFVQLMVNIKLVIFDGSPVMDIVKGLVKSISFVAFIYLFVLVAKQGKVYLEVILSIYLLICIFGILVHPISPLSGTMFELKSKLFPLAEDGLGKTLSTEQDYISGGYADRFRLSGPFSTSILFSYFAISCFIFNFYMLLKYKKKIYLASLCIVFIASVLTQTRSLLLGEMVVVFGYLFLVPGKRSKLYKIKIASLAIIGILFLYVVRLSNDEIMGGSRLTTVSSEGKKDSRPYLWLTGLYTAIKHPFGISDADYDEVKQEMFQTHGLSHILKYPSHNGLINIAFQYSFFGYIIFIFFMFFLWKQMNLLNGQFSLFFKIALLGYFAHSFFHNDFIFDEDYQFLLVLTLIWYEKFTSSANTNPVIEENVA